MPLSTIFTKWPAPLGPQCRYPCSAGQGVPFLPRVRGAALTPGGMLLKIGLPLVVKVVLVEKPLVESELELLQLHFARVAERQQPTRSIQPQALVTDLESMEEIVRPPPSRSG